MSTVSTDALVSNLLQSVTPPDSSSLQSTANTVDNGTPRSSTSDALSQEIETPQEIVTPSFSDQLTPSSQDQSTLVHENEGRVSQNNPVLPSFQANTPSISSSDSTNPTGSNSTNSPPVVPSLPSPNGTNNSTTLIEVPLVSATNEDDTSSSTVGLFIGITISVLVLVIIAVLVFFKFRRNRNERTRKSIHSPPSGAACLTVPPYRGFKKEQELGMPEMSIELSPQDLGLSKGFDASYASSTRSSTASNQYKTSAGSSTGSSVFNTQGGLSPTFSNRKMASYSYQYRDSEGGANSNLASSTTFHLTGMIGNGQTSGRGHYNSSRGLAGRKLSAPDEYAELVSATNAHGKMDLAALDHAPKTMYADFTQTGVSQDEMDISMGPDEDNYSVVEPLPPRTAPVQTRSKPAGARTSEESMGPDSPLAGRSKQTGSIYDIIPNLSGEKIMGLPRTSDEDLHAMSTASFLSESSISSTSTRNSIATTAHEAAFVSSTPLLQYLPSAENSDYGDDTSSERASTESSGSANMARSGSLIALDLKAKGGSSEIAI